jgi:hypothetical protein
LIEQSPNAYNPGPIAKNQVLDGCNSKSCKFKCSTKISKIRRSIINKDYWKQSTDNKRKWIAVHCERRRNAELPSTTTRKPNVSRERTVLLASL